MQIGFTKKAEEALQHAETVATELRHGSIGSEHILIGLLRTEGCLARDVLLDCGVDEDKLIEIMNQVMNRMNSVGVVEPDSYTPRAVKVLETAGKEARRFGASLIGTEHILIGIPSKIVLHSWKGGLQRKFAIYFWGMIRIVTYPESRMLCWR